MKEQVTQALLIFVIPPSMEALFQRLRARATETADELELRQRNAALELARQDDYDKIVDQRDRPGRADGGEINGSSPRSIAATRPAASGSDADAGRAADARDRARCPSPATDRAVDRRPTGRRGAGRRRRHVEVAIDAAGGGGARRYTYAVPPRSPTSRRARRSSSSSAGARRSAIILGDAPPPDGDRRQADRRARPGRRAAPAAPGPRPRRLDRRPLPRPAGARPPGDAAAGSARAARARRRADRGPAAAAGLAAGRARPARPARARSAPGPRPRRAPRAGPGSSGGCGRSRTRGLVTLDWTLLAAGARTALRALDPADGDRPRGGGQPGRRRATAGPAARARARLAALAELLAAGASRPAGSRPRGGPARRRARRTAGASRASPGAGLVEVEVRERPRRPLAVRPRRAPRRPPAGAELTAAAGRGGRRRSARRSRRGDPTPLLLDGVTGGGKTAIYVEAIVASLERGRPALVLVPEIALAMPLVDRLRADLDARVALVHSGLGDGERADEWRRIRAGDVDIVVGTRLAVARAAGGRRADRRRRGARGGLQERPDAAPPGARRGHRAGRLAGAAVVLGSATPAVESVGRARDGTYRRVVLPDAADRRAAVRRGRRPPRGAGGGQPGPAVAAARRARSRPSTARPATRRSSSINRRGTRVGRPVPRLRPRPGLPGVRAAAGLPPGRHDAALPSLRPRRRRSRRAARTARSPRIRYLGGGTERVEREVRERFPDLRVGRLDRDVVERRGAAERVIDAFADGRLDVLVGTSLVTKGLDIPEVTLVGVVSADVALNLPDERAAERTYQLLAQAVGPGRARRAPGAGDHPDLPARAPRDPGRRRPATPQAFYDAELELRRRFGSPPFGRLVKLTVGLPDRGRRGARGDGDGRAAPSRGRGSGAQVVASSGPAPAYIATARRSAGAGTSSSAARTRPPCSTAASSAPWSVDVDPESLL